jgi:hypothetical protein
MWQKIAAALVVAGAVAGPTPASAARLIESYTAVLSERDHFNSNGERLHSAAAIIRQDRANYHRFGLQDDGDSDDAYFSDANNRDTLERLLNNGTADPGVVSRIVNGVVEVRVDVYRGSGGDYIVVTLVND